MNAGLVHAWTDDSIPQSGYDGGMAPLTSPYDPSESTTTGVDKSADRIRRMFGEIASRYDVLNHLLSLNIDRFWRWRTVRMVPPRDEWPILDVCSGTGDLALAYDQAARQCRLGIPIIATDFCAPMLKIGRAKAAQAGAQERITFIEADTHKLPFEDGQFQIVSVAFGLRNVSDLDRGLAEMVRVCRPKGRVAVLEFSMPKKQPIKAMYGWYFRHILPWIGQRLARNATNAYGYLPDSVGQFPQWETFAGRMHAAGLREVRFYPFTGGIATLYVGVK